MAELVGDDALQLVPVELLDRSAGHTDGGIVQSEAGGEGVDAWFGVHQVDGGHGHAGGDGHFLDHVDQLALFGAFRGRVDLASAHRFGHPGTALALQLCDPPEAAEGDQRHHYPSRPGQAEAAEQSGRSLAAGLVMIEDDAHRHREVNRRNDKDHGECKI